MTVVDMRMGMQRPTWAVLSLMAALHAVNGEMQAANSAMTALLCAVMNSWTNKEPLRLEGDA